jgi:hypothetical protein
MNWKGFGRKLLWPDPGICPDRLRKSKKSPVSIVSFLIVIPTGNLHNANLENFSHNNLFGDVINVCEQHVIKSGRLFLAPLTEFLIWGKKEFVFLKKYAVNTCRWLLFRISAKLGLSLEIKNAVSEYLKSKC